MTDDLLNHPLISGRYFFPQSGALAEPFWVETQGARLACSYHECDPQAKTLIHFHGNGEIVDDYLGPFVEQVQRCGCNCLLAEYRGYGLSSGRPQLGRMLDDVTAVVESLGRPAAELIFFGRSVGALFAIEAARLYPQAAGLVLESGIADLLERLLLRVDPAELGVSGHELAVLVRRRYNPQQVLSVFRGDLLVMHTAQDGLVDVAHGEQLYAWGGRHKTLRIFPAGDHNSILHANFAEYFREFAAFVADL